MRAIFVWWNLFPVHRGHLVLSRPFSCVFSRTSFYTFLSCSSSSSSSVKPQGRCPLCKRSNDCQLSNNCWCMNVDAKLPTPSGSSANSVCLCHACLTLHPNTVPKAKHKAAAAAQLPTRFDRAISKLEHTQLEKSPCVKICKISVLRDYTQDNKYVTPSKNNQPSDAQMLKLCSGCGRSLQEITKWSRFNVEEKVRSKQLAEQRLILLKMQAKT